MVDKKVHIIQVNNVAHKKKEIKRFRRDSNPRNSGIHDAFGTLVTAKPLDQLKFMHLSLFNRLFDS